MGDVRRIYPPDGSRVDVFHVNGSGQLIQHWAPVGGSWTSGVLASGCVAHSVPEAEWNQYGNLDVYVEYPGNRILHWWSDTSAHTEIIG